MTEKNFWNNIIILYYYMSIITYIVIEDPALIMCTHNNNIMYFRLLDHLVERGCEIHMLRAIIYQREN